VKQVQVSASLSGSQITGLPLKPTLAGPGHYIVNGAFLNQVGTWDVGVTIRTSAFNEYTKQFEVPIK
jgi:copper transport protein